MINGWKIQGIHLAKRMKSSHDCHVNDGFFTTIFFLEDMERLEFVIPSPGLCLFDDFGNQFINTVLNVTIKKPSKSARGPNIRAGMWQAFLTTKENTLYD